MHMNKIYKLFLTIFLLFFLSNLLLAQELNKKFTDTKIEKIEAIIFNDLSKNDKTISLQSYLLSDEERNTMISKLSILVDSASLNAFGDLNTVLKSEAINYIFGYRNTFKKVEFMGMDSYDYFSYELNTFYYKIDFLDDQTPSSTIKVIFTRLDDEFKLLFIYNNNLNF